MKAATTLGLMFLATAVWAQTDGQIQAKFDKALRTANGKLLLEVLRPEEKRGVGAEAVTRFLKRFVSPWLKEPGIVVMRGKNLALGDSSNPAQVVFRPTGGMTYEIVEKRSHIFVPPVVTVGGKKYAGVGFAQLLFAYASHKANSKARSGLQEAEEMQRLVESWIPEVSKWGIKGSVEPELGKFQDWKTVIKQSRAELAKMKKG
jgi:hypothetical protein